MSNNDKELCEKMVAEYSLWELKHSIDGIRGVVDLLLEPESIEQARENLKGIGRYVESVLAKYEISTKWHE